MSGPRLPSLAWRNIWRNRRRTIITLLGIAFGVLLATILTGIGDSTYSAMINHAARLGGGHVVVQHPEYAELPSLKSTVLATDRRLAELRRQPEVRGVAVRITGGLMLSTSKNSVGAGVIAIDPRAEDETTLGFVDAISQGEMFTGPDDKGIILGKVLAENLDAEIGKKVVYAVTNKQGEIANGLARVTGIIETGAAEVDAATCLLPIGALRKVLSYAPNEATQVAVFLDSHRSSQMVAERMQSSFGDAVSVLPWDEAQPELTGFVAMKEGSTVIMESIITVLIAAGIFNTLFVSVMERMREFGILAAIGFSSLQLTALILWESLWVSLVGLLAGIAITAWPYYYLATTGIDTSTMTGSAGQAQVAGITMSPIIYVEIHPPHALVIAVAVVLATVAAGIFPAFKAGRVSPVEAIRIV